jgi:hypothetical protein
MKTIAAVLLTVAVLAPASWATHEKITEARIAKIEERLFENYRADQRRGLRLRLLRSDIQYCLRYRPVYLQESELDINFKPTRREIWAWTVVVNDKTRCTENFLHPPGYTP